MSLRAIKKEAWNLQDIEKDLSKFQESWIKPVKSNNNNHLPFLQSLPEQFRKSINTKISEIQKTLQKARNGQKVNEKLRSYARHLIELKLTTIQGNTTKYNSITNNLLYDDYWNFQKTIQEVKSFSKSVRSLSHQYNEVNNLLQKQLSLENSLLLMDQPHKSYLKSLRKTASQQKRIVKDLGEEFITLVKNGS